MQTSNDELTDALIRHEVYLLLYGAFVSRQMSEILNSTETKIASVIRDGLRDIGKTVTAKDWKTIKKVTAEVLRIRKSAWTKVQTWLGSEMNSLAKADVNNVDSIIKSVLPVVVETTKPSARKLRDLADEIDVDGRTMGEWLNRLIDNDLRRVKSAIFSGATAGDGSSAVARKVVGTANVNGSDGVTEITRTQIVPIALTTVKAVSDQARQAWTLANTLLIDQIIFLAILDERTCTGLCPGFHRKRFSPNDGPFPPLHMRCRCGRVPILATALIASYALKSGVAAEYAIEFADEMGIELDDGEVPEDFSDEFDQWSEDRAIDEIGDAPDAPKSYEEWIRKQSESFQDLVLGNRAKLFRDGSITLDKFALFNSSGLTLKQIARLHKADLKAAGFDVLGFDN